MFSRCSKNDPILIIWRCNYNTRNLTFPMTGKLTWTEKKNRRGKEIKQEKKKTREGCKRKIASIYIIISN